jgi:hypothetical protein
MRNAFQCVLLAASATLVGAPAADAAQAAGAPAAAKVSRLPDGKPNLNGIWQAMNTANFDLEPHNSRAALQMIPGPLGPIPAPQVVALGAVGSVPDGLGVVEGGEIPYKPEALAKKKENQQNWIKSDPEIKCYLPGVPRATYMPYPFQIVQSKDYTFIAYEYAGAVRNVYMKDPGEAPTDSWMGQSAGHWEGDTLVVNVTGLNDQTWLSRAGDWHTENMHVTERYTLKDNDHILYEATIEDPTVFTRPWKISMPLYRHIEKDAQLGQFKCVEFVEELMYGHLRKVPTEPDPKKAKPEGGK